MQFSCKKLVVIGAGLIGGSLIKSLKQNHCEIDEIIAVGRNLDVLKKAQQDGFIDGYSNDTGLSVLGADVVVVGTPVGTMAEQFRLMYENLDSECVITDVGSVKTDVVSSAQAGLKEKFRNFVPAHPISGTEHSGFDASFAELFEGRVTVITPLEQNNAKQIEVIRSMWRSTGSELLEMSYVNHDKVFAATSHLPHVLVYALMNAISGLDDSDKYFRVVAGGFLDYTRIASSDAVMWRDVCLTNQAPIIEMINIYKSQLNLLQRMIEEKDAQGLYKQFEQAKQTRDKLVDKRLKEKQN